jgi:hypothetical protein
MGSAGPCSGWGDDIGVALDELASTVRQSHSCILPNEEIGERNGGRDAAAH